MNDEALRIEAMEAADWPAVERIYAEGIEDGQATFETAAPGWEAWDRGNLAFGRLLARAGAEVVGWGALAPVSARPCYAGVAEATVYVARAWRGRGAGAELLGGLVAVSEAHGIWTLQGATFPENTASLALQARLGFRVIGRRERIGKHHGRWRDTVLTERRSPRVD